MARQRNDIIQGTLALSCSRPWPHKGACTATPITAHIQRASAELLRMEGGSL